MKISTKGRYALRLMLDLAINYNGEYIPARSIASRQEISEKYLEQIVIMLSRAGLVKSTRGAQGGYMLARDPKDYTVGMILRVMEGDLAPVACLADGASACGRAENCITLGVWKKLQSAIEGVVDSITLADLVNQHHEDGTLDYMI